MGGDINYLNLQKIILLKSQLLKAFLLEKSFLS